MKRISSQLVGKAAATQTLVLPAKLLVLLTGIVLGTAGCAGLQRSRASGYSGSDSDKQVVRPEQEEQARTDNPDSDESAASLRKELWLAEANLEGKREREQYFKYKPYMKSDRERLQFLKLGSFDTRQRWLASKNGVAQIMQASPQMQALVDANDIAIGMTKQAVRDSWGEADLVEVSGNPIYGNERWHYSEQTSSADGYQTQRRILYFEGGRVVGWESH